jgi:VWFA-related protein
MRRLSLTLLTILLALPVAAQQPSLSERLDVNAVLIDVVVTDKSGNQILGLTKDDFVVTEEGTAQPLDSVDYFTTRTLLTTREGKAPFNVEQVREERYLIFFFDKPMNGSLFANVGRARRAVNDFIDRDMGKNDYVAIVGHDSRLKVFSDFTSNKQELKKALDDVNRFSNGLSKTNSPAGAPSILRSIAGDERMMDGTGRVYDAIRMLAAATQSIRARKNLVLFSPGIIDPSEEIRNGMVMNMSRFYEPMIRALNTANVTVYAANLLLEDAPSEPMFHQSLERLTAETNGEYFRQAVSFQPIIRQVQKSSGGYYLLTYRTQKPRGTSGYQKVEVSVRNQPQFRVKARPGYVYGG